MAAIEYRVSDLSGAEGDVSPASLVVGRQAVDIDLTAEEFEELKSVLEVYTSAGRKRIKGKAAKYSTPPTEGKDQLRAMREWLNSHGYDVPKRGAIAPELHEAYHQRQPNFKDVAQ